MSILGLSLIVLGTVFSFFGTYFSDKRGQEELTTKIQEKNETIENINANNVKLIEQNSDLLISNKDVTSSNEELISQSKEMLDKISRYQEEIKEKDREISELQKKVNQVERGIEFKVQFNGAHRSRQGGSMSLSLGTEEGMAFEELLECDREKKYDAMIDICDRFIAEQSQWYTPYIFKAHALLAIDVRANRQKALELLDYASKMTSGDIEFGEPIMRILLSINEYERITEILKNFPTSLLRSINDADLLEKLLKLKI